MTKQKMEYVSAGNLFLIYFEDILDNFTRFKFLAGNRLTLFRHFYDQTKDGIRFCRKPISYIYWG